MATDVVGVQRVRAHRRLRTYVVAVDAPEKQYQHGHDNCHHPGTGGELCDQDHHQNYRREQCAEPVDREPSPPAGLAADPPPPNHPRLRKREGEEDADRVERDKGFRLGSEDNHEHRRAERHGDDPVGVSEAVAHAQEHQRRVAIPGKEVEEPGKVAEGRIRGEGQDQRRADLDEEVGRSATKGQRRKL